MHWKFIVTSWCYVCTFYNPFFNTDISFSLQCTYMFCHNIKPRSWSVHILLMFFLTTVYSKVGIVTKHFTSGHFVYNELGRVSIHTASKEITDSFPYSDLSILFCFCTVVNKWWEWCNVPCVFPLLSFLKVVILHSLRAIGQIQALFAAILSIQQRFKNCSKCQ